MAKMLNGCWAGPRRAGVGGLVEERRQPRQEEQAAGRDGDEGPGGADRRISGVRSRHHCHASTTSTAPSSQIDQ